MKKNILLGLLGFIFLLCIRIHAEEPPQGTDISLYHEITLKDGVKLSANVYKPAGMEKPLPVVFAFSPYISDEGQNYGTFFAANGYVYVHADVRGRGNSQGHFLPLENDGADGAQVVSWIKKQPWCDGNVVMRGGSYRGGVQWQIVKHAPSALKSIVPTASVCFGLDVPNFNNIFSAYTTRWLALTSGRTMNNAIFGDSKYWQEKFYYLYSNYLPFARLAEITGSNQEVFARWLAHPQWDDFWKNVALKETHYNALSLPILTITGYFDGDQPGAMHYYKQHMTHGTIQAKAEHYILLGPWTHGGTRYPTKETGGLVFSDDSVLDMKKLHLQWYDWVLKGKEKPDLLKKRVTYYMMGENTWKYADKLEDISNATVSWYLSSRNGEANDVFRSGGLDSNVPSGSRQPDSFEYDPLRLIPWSEYNNDTGENFLLNQSSAFSEGPVKVIYHSPPLAQDLETAGYIKFSVYLSMNVPDTDLHMRLYEISKDGKSILLAEDIKRARYRTSLSQAQLITPGEIHRYDFAGSYFFARKLSAGSRLRLILQGLNHPEFQKNYNSGGEVSQETNKDARKAIINVYHSKQYPSRLELPVKIKK